MYLLIRSVALYVLKKPVKVLLQLCVTQSEAGTDRPAWQPGIQRVNLPCHLLIENNCQVFLNRHVHLPTLQSRKDVGDGAQTYDVGIRCVACGCHVLNAADDYCHAFALQSLEDGRHSVGALRRVVSYAVKECAAFFSEKAYMRGTCLVREEYLLPAFLRYVDGCYDHINLARLNRREE